MGGKNKRTGKAKGMTNSQVNFMIAKAMRSGAYKKVTELAKSGAPKDEIILALARQYNPHALPGQEKSKEDLNFIDKQLDRIADQLIARYAPKDEDHEEQ